MYPGLTSGNEQNTISVLFDVAQFPIRRTRQQTSRDMEDNCLYDQQQVSNRSTPSSIHFIMQQDSICVWAGRTILSTQSFVSNFQGIAIPGNLPHDMQIMTTQHSQQKIISWLLTVQYSTVLLDEKWNASQSFFLLPWCVPSWKSCVQGTDTDTYRTNEQIREFRAHQKPGMREQDRFKASMRWLSRSFEQGHAFRMWGEAECPLAWTAGIVKSFASTEERPFRSRVLMIE